MRVEDVEDPLMRKIRQLDKLVDELAPFVLVLEVFQRDELARRPGHS